MLEHKGLLSSESIVLQLSDKSLAYYVLFHFRFHILNFILFLPAIMLYYSSMYFLPLILKKKFKLTEKFSWQNYSI